MKIILRKNKEIDFVIEREESRLINEGNEIEIGLACRYTKVIAKENEPPKPKRKSRFRFW